MEKDNDMVNAHLVDENDITREVNKIIRSYSGICKSVKRIEKRRPSLLRTFFEIDSQAFRDRLKNGTTGFGERDVTTLKTYLWNVWALDVVKTTLDERADSRDAEVFKAVCLGKLPIDEAADRFGISTHTIERIRVKVKHDIADEIRLRWNLNRAYLDYNNSLSSDSVE